MYERIALVKRMKKLRDEIALTFSKADHWNREHPTEQPIDPDPNGELKRLAEGLDRSLANEERIKGMRRN